MDAICTTAPTACPKGPAIQKILHRADREEHSFFVLSGTFPIFSGIFPICSGMVRGFSPFVLFLFLGQIRAPMDQYRSRLKLSENFERHWSIPIYGETHMDQSLVHTFSWGNSYGRMVLKVLQKFPPTLVHGWLFPGRA